MTPVASVLLDAVVVYRIFGLSLDALFAFVRVLATCAVIYLIVRVPFKRKYHWAFLALNVSYLWGTFWAGVAQLTTYSASKAEFYYNIQSITSGQSNDLAALLIFQFVVLFIGPRISTWQKCALIGGYVYVAATTWAPLALGDSSFIHTTPHLSSFGWISGPGTSTPYLVPSGIPIFVTPMAVLIYYLLIRYYHSTKLPLVKAQAKYLMVGFSFFFLGVYQHAIQQGTGTAGQNLPTLNNLLSVPGEFIAVFGLRKKGFYSVTPVAETAPLEKPLVYPLEEARSYLAHDPRPAFESFSELVRNGHEGLIITRNFPQNVRKDYGLKTTPIRWLAEEKGIDAIPPGDLLGLSLTIKDFLEKAKKPVVILHGVEYLTTINGFTPILRLIQGLSDENATKNGILILPVTPKSLDEREEALLATETTPMPMPVAS